MGNSLILEKKLTRRCFLNLFFLKIQNTNKHKSPGSWNKWRTYIFQCRETKSRIVTNGDVNVSDHERAATTSCRSFSLTDSVVFYCERRSINGRGFYFEGLSGVDLKRQRPTTGTVPIIGEGKTFCSWTRTSVEDQLSIFTHLNQKQEVTS